MSLSKQNNMKKIDFGPPLYLTNISEELRLELLIEGKKQKTPYNKTLAGKIKREYGFSKNLTAHFEKYIVKYIDEYINEIIVNTNHSGIKSKYKLDELWINFQEKNEYNPPHFHSGHISFVIYLDVPEIIQTEKSKTSNDNVNGNITFIYGNNTNLISTYNLFENIVNEVLSPISRITHKPKTGEMFIFPSYLIHYVESFHSDNVERISISGNITINQDEIKSLI